MWEVVRHLSTGIITAEITNAPQNKSQVIHSLSYSETRVVDCFRTIGFELVSPLFHAPHRGVCRLVPVGYCPSGSLMRRAPCRLKTELQVAVSSLF